MIQVLSQDGTTTVLTRTMMAAIQKWIVMICAILKTKILTFHQVQLPMSDHTLDLPDWTDMSQDAFNKAFSALPFPLKGPRPPGCSIYEAI
jgi:hypothetical protein